jgi:hypothetical protein
MARLPAAHRAVVDPEKLRDYVLSPDHVHGRHKARVFLSALGIDQNNWEYLREQIITGVMDAETVKILDVVELTVASGRWAKGTRATVLELLGSDAALVEIADDRGHTLEELELPLDVLRIVGRPSQRLRTT